MILTEGTIVLYIDLLTQSDLEWFRTSEGTLIFVVLSSSVTLSTDDIIAWSFAPEYLLGQLVAN